MCSPLPSAPLPLLSSSSSPPRCPELDLSLLHSPNPTHPKPKPHPSREIPRAQTTHQTSSKKTSGRTHRQVRFEGPVVVKVTAEPSSSSSNLPSNNEQLSRGHRRRGRRHVDPKDHRACPPTVVPNGESVRSEVADCLLEEAEPNTLLALKAELKSLEGAEFNSQHAVQETLRSSVRTKNLINTKATEAVNFPPSQHLLSSLVSLSVEEDQLISQALRDRLPLAPPTRLHDNKQTDGPSLLPFVTSVLFREMPLLLGEEPSNKPRPQPTPHPAHSTFDLYRRHTQWQA